MLLCTFGYWIEIINYVLSYVQTYTFTKHGNAKHKNFTKVTNFPVK